MNYIYDIIINLNQQYYDFFEWNQNDIVYHIRKIPIFKIETKDYLNIVSRKFSVDNKFLDIIKNKTDVFANSNDTLKYCCLFTDGNDVIAISFNSNGQSLLKSDLLIDEALDILEISLHFKNTIINYHIINNCDDPVFFTRDMIKTRDRILKKIENIAISDDSILKYLYYECFNEEESDRNKILNRIINNIQKEDILTKLNKFFRLISNYK